MVIMGFLQFVSLISMFVFDSRSKSALVGVMFCANFCDSYMDVIVDAMMVTSSRNDTEDGSEKLNAISWGAKAIGGIFGSFVGGYLTGYYHPKWIFLFNSCFGIIVMILALQLDSKQEEDEINSLEKKSFLGAVKFSLVQVRDTFKQRQVLNVMLFFGLIFGIFTPSFDSYTYYF